MKTYSVIDKPERVYIVDENGVEIAGARRAFGHEVWTIYPTVRLTKNAHQVFAYTREAAVFHLRMLAELYHPELEPRPESQDSPIRSVS